VGIALACQKVNIGLAISVIGITTFIICFAGVIIGNNFGAKYQKKAQICGGLVLIGIGIKILIEGLIK